MPIRLKKLIGTVLLVALVIVYALAATTIAAGRLAESGPVVHLIFFLVIRPALDPAGDGHHQMDAARAEAARLVSGFDICTPSDIIAQCKCQDQSSTRIMYLLVVL